MGVVLCCVAAAAAPRTVELTMRRSILWKRELLCFMMINVQNHLII